MEQKQKMTQVQVNGKSALGRLSLTGPVGF